MNEEESNEIHVHEEEPSRWKGPLRIILMIFLLFLVVLWIVPHYGIKLNPEPSGIPTLPEIQSLFLYGTETGNGTGISDIKKAGREAVSPAVKQVANSISAQSCPESGICHAKALYYFVRDNIQYVSDPYEKEYVASPVETLKTGGGDCEDGALLLAAMIESVGISTEIVVIPGHALIKAYMPEAPKKYRIGDWVYMDWTCSRCRFGEIPYNDVLQLSD